MSRKMNKAQRLDYEQSIMLNRIAWSKHVYQTQRREELRRINNEPLMHRPLANLEVAWKPYGKYGSSPTRYSA